MMRSTAAIAALALCVCSGAVVRGQQPVNTVEPRRAEVLVLGVYHMANPGQDIINLKADDVLAPKRQADIVELVTVLKTFRPTAIAVERSPGDRRLSNDYAAYVAGRHELTPNEIEQIGFRLAKELGHTMVHGVDADGEFPYPRVVKFANATGRSKELDALMADWERASRAANAFLLSHSVLQTLLYMNADERVAEEVGFYYRQSHFGERWDWAGPDLVADWFRRNMRIYSNVMQLAASPTERVLVIFGAGHLGWLRHNFESDPTVHLRTLAEFAR
jgi:hypothetical protein